MELKKGTYTENIQSRDGEYRHKGQVNEYKTCKHQISREPKEDGQHMLFKDGYFLEGNQPPKSQIQGLQKNISYKILQLK